jgi:predicted PurR-regulated permease PerM
MFAVAFYLLRDAGKLSRLLARFGDDRGVYDAYARAVDKSLETVFFGNILNAIMTGAIGAISYSLLDLSLVAPAGLSIPYPALTGLLAGIASLIPVVGMKIVYVPVAVYLTGTAYFQGSGYWYVATFVAVSFVVVDSVPDLFLRPYVTGKNLHVGSVMIAYILGPLMFGWYGLFLGPIILVLVVHFVRIVLPVLLEKEALRPVPVDPRYMTGADPGASAERAVRDPEPEVAADGAPEDAGDETGA